MNYKEVYRRPPITDPKWTLPFGKHKGKTIEWLMDYDPQYLQWALDKEMLELDHILQDTFEEMNPWMLQT